MDVIKKLRQRIMGPWPLTWDYNRDWLGASPSYEAYQEFILE